MPCLWHQLSLQSQNFQVVQSNPVDRKDLQVLVGQLDPLVLPLLSRREQMFLEDQLHQKARWDLCHQECQAVLLNLVNPEVQLVREIRCPQDLQKALVSQCHQAVHENPVDQDSPVPRHHLEDQMAPKGRKNLEALVVPGPL